MENRLVDLMLPAIDAVVVAAGLLCFISYDPMRCDHSVIICLFPLVFLRRDSQHRMNDRYHTT